MHHHRTADILAKLAGLGLAVAITTALLAGVGGMADQQYHSAWLAHAGSQPITVAQNEAPVR